MVRVGEERQTEERHPPASQVRTEERALSQAQRARARPLALEVSINAEGIVDLCVLRWLDPHKLEDPTAVNDAIVDLTNEAFKLRLQPPTA